ncbi:PIG-L family deacetylase [uncultured Paracoccus sp.]|uniref:PIG-L deacetylase family protein n=1 Tax=uncultured Paracoccus sp. TaxID=189685 RepID=UPI0026200943|nr:PIG-L family deacetylase [uncultured Paracoccus sp.]
MLEIERGGPILAIAPHPDDETIGAGGLLLRAAAAGREIHWLIVTTMRPEDGWPTARIESREAEIEAVAREFGFAAVHRLGLPTTRLDTLPLGDVVAAIGDVVKVTRPQMLLLPHRGDAHSDHQVVHDAGAACAKWFRYPSVQWTLAYETLSETDAAIQQMLPFRSDIYVDISAYLEHKIAITRHFAGEFHPFPFPRSETAVRAQGQMHGAAAGYQAAEAFMLLRGRM